MNTTLRNALRVAMAIAAVVPTALAFAQQSKPATPETSWRNECGSCHVPYPPNLLPAADWRTLMATLDRHFGDDASLDARVAADIGRFLEAGAGRRGESRSLGLPRITTGRWFANEHREVPLRIWASAKVKTRANCGACHPGAAKGDFEDDDITIPR